jgi:hypothetical protein
MIISTYGAGIFKTGVPIIALLICLLLAGTVHGQPSPRSNVVNPDYAFPVKETPAEVEVNSASLVENAAFWNERSITFKGEAIGECMVRGDMAWIHLNDDAYMERNIEEGAPLGGYNSGHAVWLSAEIARQIRYWGDFKHEGDIVKATGIFHAACREHGGDMDIHATSMYVIRTGHPVRHHLNVQRAAFAAILLIIVAVLYGVRRSVAHRRI